MKSSTPLDLQVQATSVLDEAERRLHQAILRGELRPGQRLLEADISKRMGISRTSLREAMRRLEALELIVLAPNKGVFVAELGPAEIEELRDVWQILTGEAVARFATRGTSEEFAVLERILNEMDGLSQSNDALQLLAATNSFFTVILKGAANRPLRQFIRILMSRINFLRSQSLSDAGQRRLHIGQLRATHAHLKKRQGKRARDCIEEHIDCACAGAMKMSTNKELVA